MDLALNNLQRLICHKTQQTKPKQSKEPHLDKSKEQYQRIAVKFYTKETIIRHIEASQVFNAV